VLGGVSPLDAVLVEVIADGHLAAESVPAVLHVDLVEVVVEGVHQHRNAKLRRLEGPYDALLVAEVRQADDHAVDPCPVGLEERRVLRGVGPRLDGAVGCRFLFGDCDSIAELREHGEQIPPALGRELRAEKSARSHDHAESHLSIHRCHPDLPW
jgi:hypothetical protein